MLWPEEGGATFLFGENQDHKMSYCEVDFGSLQKGFFLQLDPCQLTPEVGVGFIMRQGIPFTRDFQREGANCFLVWHVVEEIHASERWEFLTQTASDGHLITWALLYPNEDRVQWGRASHPQSSKVVW